MVSLVSPHLLYDARAVFDPLFKLAGQGRGLLGEVLGGFDAPNGRHELARFRFTGPLRGQQPIKLGLFAGLHGDEPAGCAALATLAENFLRDPELATNYEVFFYPVCNPAGLAAGTRFNGSGKDLNREFWIGSREPEVRLLEQELSAHRFDGIITLHSDDTCSGLYGYAHGRLLNENLLKPALLAASRVLPRDTRAMIDGFNANDGVLCECFRGVLAAPSTQSPQPFDIIFETPALAPFDQQVEATVAAVQTILDEYRGFIAQAQNI